MPSTAEPEHARDKSLQAERLGPVCTGASVTRMGPSGSRAACRPVFDRCRLGLADESERDIVLVISIVIQYTVKLLLLVDGADPPSEPFGALLAKLLSMKPRLARVIERPRLTQKEPADRRRVATREPEGDTKTRPFASCDGVSHRRSAAGAFRCRCKAHSKTYGATSIEDGLAAPEALPQR